jgi:uncharacterized protein YjbJ (UPF0337 family)
MTGWRFGQTVRHRSTLGAVTVCPSDKTSGKANAVTREAKQAVGDATFNRSIEATGAAQKAQVDARQAKAHAKNGVKNVVDDA